MRRHWEMLRNSLLGQIPIDHLYASVSMESAFQDDGLSLKQQLSYICDLIENLSFSDKPIHNPKEVKSIQALIQNFLQDLPSKEQQQDALSQMLFSGRRSKSVLCFVREIGNSIIPSG